MRCRKGEKTVSVGQKAKLSGRELISKRNSAFIKFSSLLLTVLRICSNTGQILSSEPISFTFHIQHIWTKTCQGSSNALQGLSHSHLQCGPEPQDSRSLSTKPCLSRFQALPSHVCLSSPVLTLLISRHLTPCFAWTLPSARQHIDGL